MNWVDRRAVVKNRVPITPESNDTSPIVSQSLFFILLTLKLSQANGAITQNPNKCSEKIMFIGGRE